jgi:hypothetical protein
VAGRNLDPWGAKSGITIIESVASKYAKGERGQRTLMWKDLRLKKKDEAMAQKYKDSEASKNV